MENISNQKAPSCPVKIGQLNPILSEDAVKAKIFLKNLPEKKGDCLSKIPEVTEDYDLQGKTLRCEKKVKINIEQNTMHKYVEDKDKKRSSIVNRLISSIFRKSINCIAFTYQKIYSQINSEEINVAESQITQMLSKLRKKKQRKICLLPQLQLENKKTLVLDLDQTLISISFKKPSVFDYKVEIDRKGTKVSMYIIKRFGLQSFLYEMSKIYEIVIFSSLKCELVEQIVNLIDPKKHISHLLSRQHCIVINQCYFIKPVRDLGRNPRTVIVVDTHSISGSLNPENLYKIDRFKGSSKDRKLIKLGYFLKHVAQMRQIVPVDMYRKKFETKQILIYEKQNADRSMRRKKTQELEITSQNSGEHSVQTFSK